MPYCREVSPARARRALAPHSRPRRRGTGLSHMGRPARLRRQVEVASRPSRPHPDRRGVDIPRAPPWRSTARTMADRLASVGRDPGASATWGRRLRTGGLGGASGPTRTSAAKDAGARRSSRLSIDEAGARWAKSSRSTPSRAFGPSAVVASPPGPWPHPPCRGGVGIPAELGSTPPSAACGGGSAGVRVASSLRGARRAGRTPRGRRRSAGSR